MSSPDDREPGWEARIRLNARREVNTYADLWHASASVLAATPADGRGATWLRMSSALLAAFTFEAYCNHLGPMVLRSWGDLDKALGPVAKFSLLCEAVGADPLLPGHMPMQAVNRLFKFRNSVAHGRSEALDADPVFLPLVFRPEDAQVALLVTWEVQIQDGAFVAASRAAVEAALKHLHGGSKNPLRGSHLFARGATYRQYTLVSGVFPD